jgi:hypothetical protein
MGGWTRDGRQLIRLPAVFWREFLPLLEGSTLSSENELFVFVLVRGLWCGLLGLSRIERSGTTL